MDRAKTMRGDVAKSTEKNPNLQRIMANITLESLLKEAGPAIKKEQIQVFNSALQKRKKS